MITTAEKILSVTAELAAVQAHHRTVKLQVSELRQGAQSAKARQTARAAELLNLTTLLNEIGLRTAELRATLATKTEAAAAAEAELLAAESKTGLAGIDPAKAVKVPAEGSSSGVTALEAEFSRLRAEEDAGRVERGASHKFYRENRAAFDRQAKPVSSPNEEPRDQSWGASIVRRAGEQ